MPAVPRSQYQRLVSGAKARTTQHRCDMDASEDTDTVADDADHDDLAFGALKIIDTRRVNAACGVVGHVLVWRVFGGMSLIR